ncbi:MAG: helix-turn-helix domain-containing protein [Chloroflexi bacterium]|nr:helix-turn-helix domain-containing protein [Chloroflexota bacterium]
MVPPVPTPDALPAVTVVEITEPTAVNAGIELYALEAVQLQSVPLRARRVVVRLGWATVVFHSTNLRIRTRTTIAPGLVAYVAFGPNTQGSVNGVPIRSGMMLSAESGAEAVFVAEAGYESMAFLLPEQDLREHLAARQREAGFHRPHGIEPLHVDPERVRGLFDWGKRLVDVAARQPAIFNEGPRERNVALIELLETLLATLGDADVLEPTRDDRTRQAHGLIVKKAEDYVLSRAGDDLYVSDLCRVAAVSERALQNAFKEVMGLTPLAYLTRVRLHRVREALLAGSQATTTVSVEALKWGFWHFGDFSRAYKDCFGELPSDTLHRSAGTRQP